MLNLFMFLFLQYSFLCLGSSDQGSQVVSSDLGIIVRKDDVKNLVVIEKMNQAPKPMSSPSTFKNDIGLTELKSKTRSAFKSTYVSLRSAKNDINASDKPADLENAHKDTDPRV